MTDTRHPRPAGYELEADARRLAECAAQLTALIDAQEGQ